MRSLPFPYAHSDEIYADFDEIRRFVNGHVLPPGDAEALRLALGRLQQAAQEGLTYHDSMVDVRAAVLRALGEEAQE